MSPRIEAESELRYYGCIELYAPQEPSIGTHCVAYLQLQYNEVKSPQDKPLDSYNHCACMRAFKVQELLRQKRIIAAPFCVACINKEYLAELC